MRCPTFEERAREAKRQAGTNLVHRMPVCKRMAYGDVEAQIVANLPDQANKPGDSCKGFHLDVVQFHRPSKTANDALRQALILKTQLDPVSCGVGLRVNGRQSRISMTLPQIQPTEMESLVQDGDTGP